MKCPNDRKTQMVKSSDHLDFCPHCGAERFAVERCIRDMMKEDYDWSLAPEEFAQKYMEGTPDSSFDPLLGKAYTRKNRPQK